MIQVVDLLKKDYAEIKDLVIWSEKDREEVDSLAKVGLIPQLLNTKINEDIYLYDTHLTRNDVNFLDNKVHEIYFAAPFKLGCLIFFKLLITEDFKMRFFTKDFIDEFHEKYISEHDTEPNLATVKKAFDSSWSFDPRDMEIYDYINLYNSEMNLDIFLSETIDKNILLEFHINNPKVDGSSHDTTFLSIQN